MDKSNIVNPITNQPLSAGESFWYLLLLIVLILIFTLIFQYAWNGSVTHIFGLRPINFLQALLLLIVARMLLPYWPSFNWYRV